MSVKDEKGAQLYKQTLTANTYVSKMGALAIPVSFSLNSSDPSRAIDLSVDGGLTYFTPVYDTVTASLLVVVVNAPITHIRATGAIGDVFNIVE